MPGRFDRDQHFDVIVDPEGRRIQDVLSFRFADFPEVMAGRDVRLKTVDGPTEGVIDLVSYLEYRDEGAWWVLALLNGMMDPYELPVGFRLAVPASGDVEAHAERTRRARFRPTVVDLS